MKQILKNVLKGIKQIGTETVEKSAEEGGKIVEGVITGKELLGDIKSMSDQQYSAESQKYKNKDEEEMVKLRAQMKDPGRDVEQEIEQVQKEKEQKEEDERKFLENLKIQREREKAEMEAAYAEAPGNPHKAKKSRGSAFAKGKKKSGPDLEQMSQTAEVKSKVD